LNKRDFWVRNNCYKETTMTADPLRQTDAETSSGAELEGPALRMAWATPSVTRLRAGLAETGLNSGYDGVEGTS
jgi:hypothetical protein